MQQPHLEIAQVAYHVPNIEKAAEHMNATFGAGPFFILRNIELARGTHRGQDCPFVHSSAYGQWGNVMLELVQQESGGASPFRDLFEAHQTGLHHVAVMVPDLSQAYRQFAAQGIAVATEATTLGGTDFAFLDAIARSGHFIEVYESSAQLVGFYQKVRDAAVGWSGEAPVREL